MESASYNITNDRLFFWPEKGTRLSDEDYKAATEKAGFVWWPRGCFTCVWRPAAEDWILRRGLTIEENDEADDVEGRVERYQGYAEKSEREAGYASERQAKATTDRRFEAASRAALSQTEKAAYWNDRIAGAVARMERHDNLKTCQNRVKKLEAEQRKWQRVLAEREKFVSLWKRAGSPDVANVILGGDGLMYYAKLDNGSSLVEAFRKGEVTLEFLREMAIQQHTLHMNHPQRWIEHLDMRLQYERAYTVSLHGEAAIEKKPRRVSKAPSDGLKKGSKVKVSAWIAGKTREWVGEVVSLGPRTMRVKLPPEISNEYRQDERFMRDVKRYPIVEE